MIKPAGYLINFPEGVEGDTGIVYNYVMAANGLYLVCGSPLLKANICIAPTVVRGLEPIAEFVILTKGKIPISLLDLALSVAFSKPDKEVYMAVAWEDGYHLKVPQQARKEASVQYNVMTNVVMDIHTHGALPPFFSTTDNADNQGFRLDLVIGSLLEEHEEIIARIGIYGYYAAVDIGEVFE
jgi:PRTRC genetic system protein A